MLNFIVPVRHPQNMKDPEIQKHNLSKTLLSLSNQSITEYKIIIVVNPGTLLPQLPERCEVCFVDSDPIEEEGLTIDELRPLRHCDVARKVHAGLILSGLKGFFMKVDDDDFVHKDIAKLCYENPGKDGFRVTKGYMWSENSNFLYYLNNFHNRCGTCNILKAELLDIPPQLEKNVSDRLRDMLGYHTRLKTVLQDRLTIEDIDFPAAIYNIGHGNSNMMHPNVWQLYFRNRAIHTKPIEFITKLMKLRLVTSKTKKYFFGEKSDIE